MKNKKKKKKMKEEMATTETQGEARTPHIVFVYDQSLCHSVTLSLSLSLSFVSLLLFFPF